MMDVQWFESLPEEAQSKVRQIAYLSQKAFPDQDERVKFFTEENEILGGIPGEVVNTEQGREEVYEYLCVLCAMNG